MKQKIEKEIKEAQTLLSKVKKELSKLIVGQTEIVDSLLRAMLANGHVLVEGVPGLAKTLIIRALAATTRCSFKRIQFVVDLLPSDIVGLTTYDEKTKKFYTIKGPLFSNFVLIDEINRAPAKVQSALLEAMQERQVTIGKVTYPMLRPFLIMATQNPLETAGTYLLGEAQIDRFLFKLKIGYPKTDEERLILKQNIDIHSFEKFHIKPVITPEKILKMQELAKRIHINKELEKYLVEMVYATRNPGKYNLKLGKYIAWGASPRASINLFIGAKTDALLKGSSFVTPQNIKNVAYEVLRHRILLNFEGEAENIKTDNIITELLSKVPVP